MSLRPKVIGNFNGAGARVSASRTLDVVTYLCPKEAQSDYVPVTHEQSGEGTIHQVRGWIRTSLQILVSK